MRRNCRCYVCYNTDQLEAQITGLMIKHFAIHSIKDWQLEMIMATLKGHNTLVVQPTGSGKSLCFQLLPLLTGKLTIVLTPTISLMKDQCCTLESKVSATFVGSSQTDKEIDDSTGVLSLYRSNFAWGTQNPSYIIWENTMA